MKRLSLLLSLALMLTLVGAACVRALPPTELRGTAWDYTLLPKDLPAEKGWTLSGQGVITAHDVAQEGFETQTPITQSLSLLNLRHLYYARYDPPPTSQYFNLSLEILLYNTPADAATAFAAETPTEAGWQTIAVEKIGEETRAWQYLTPEAGLDQNFYRIDFRYLNGIASVSLFGTHAVMPDETETLAYAQQIFAKMQAKATPAELQILEAAQLPDVRAQLINQDQLAELDLYLGGRWQIDERFIPGWTPTANFDEPTKTTLTDLGRLTGYQVFFRKALSEAERKLALADGLFQQVTVYKDQAGAKTALGYMVGLDGGQPIEPPAVGDEARAWSGVLTSQLSDGTQVKVAVVEITFRAGQYLASVRLQSRPMSDAEIGAAEVGTQQLATKLAEALAKNVTMGEP